MPYAQYMEASVLVLVLRSLGQPEDSIQKGLLQIGHVRGHKQNGIPAFIEYRSYLQLDPALLPPSLQPCFLALLECASFLQQVVHILFVLGVQDLAYRFSGEIPALYPKHGG